MAILKNIICDLLPDGTLLINTEDLDSIERVLIQNYKNAIFFYQDKDEKRYHTPCDLCRYSCSSSDGNPCTMCPAVGREVM